MQQNIIILSIYILPSPALTSFVFDRCFSTWCHCLHHNVCQMCLSPYSRSYTHTHHHIYTRVCFTNTKKKRRTYIYLLFAEQTTLTFSQTNSAAHTFHLGSLKRFNEEYEARWISYTIKYYSSFPYRRFYTQHHRRSGVWEPTHNEATHL